MTERELVIPHREASLDGVREYAFKHQVLHQVIYDTVLKRVRRDCHAKVAAWLGGLTGSRANDFLGVAAKHFEDAGDNANASEFYTRAAEHAKGRHAHEAVLEYVAKALALIGEDAKPESLLLRWRLLDVRERMLDLRGRRAEQQADIDALQQLADALDDDRRRGEVALRRSGIALHTADFRAMETAARQAMALADDTGGDAVFKLRAQHHLASARNLLGDVASGQDAGARWPGRGARAWVARNGGPFPRHVVFRRRCGGRSDGDARDESAAVADRAGAWRSSI